MNLIEAVWPVMTILRTGLNHADSKSNFVDPQRQSAYMTEIIVKS